MTCKDKPKVGQAFHPFRKFNGILIPEALAKSTLISPGAKLIYGRLARYAGQNGECHPAVATLAGEVGLKRRQAQNHLAALEKAKLIRRIRRSSASRQTSNGYVFLWHQIFEDGMNENAPWGVQDAAGCTVHDHAHKESQIEESHFKEKVRDLDCLARFATKRDSRQESSSSKYPRLGDALTDYMVTVEDAERVRPSERIVVDVMDAAGGASEDQVIHCLQYLRIEPELSPGTRYGPRTFSWFKTAVADYFQQKSNREVVFTPPSSNGQKQGIGLNEDELADMTDAFDTTDR